MEAAHTEDWAAWAQAAKYVVDARFGHRPSAIPGTWLGRSNTGETRFTQWNYWWQAHYLDCHLDAALRLTAQTGTTPRIHPILRGIRLHNFGTVVNGFFDDMAWLALALQRLQRDDELARFNTFHTSWSVGVLGHQLRTGITPDAGGGLFWSKKFDYKNTAANGPAALFFARSGRLRLAQSLMDWLKAHLWDEAEGVFLDGCTVQRGSSAVGRRDDTVWTYNQGPTLAALLELGGSGNLAWAEQLIYGVDRSLTFRDGAAEEPGALRLHDGGDTSLFTGILVRHLAQAACDQGLSPATRATAAEAVLATARSLSSRARRERWGFVFPTSDQGTAHGRESPELSGQLQAWMTFEAAWRTTAQL